MSDVFVSYVSDDRAIAEKISRGLEQAGLSVWWDRHIQGGVDFGPEIERQLDAAKSIVVLWSAASRDSKWVRDEAQQARDENKLVPVRLDGVQPPLGFRQTQSLDFDGWNGDPASSDFVRLIQSIRHFVGDSASSSVQAPVRKNSICVLPFVNMSGDVEQEYFSDGITEDIITDLSKVSALLVVARNTAFTFKAKSVDVSQVVRQLNVSHVLEGSVRKAGGRVRISAQLIDGATGGHVWAERYDRDLTDIFAVQEEIAAAVAKALHAKLTIGRVAPGATTKSLEAYNEVLKGRALTGYSNYESGFAAAKHFERAIELDPDYGAAHGELAIAHALNSAYAPLADIAADWSAAFKRALDINPQDSNALAAKAHYLTRTEYNWKRAGELYQQALQYGISPWAAILYASLYLGPLKKWSEQQAFYKATLQTDPYRVDILWDCAQWHLNNRAPLEAIAYWDRVLEVQPDGTDAWAGKADAYATLGDHAAARAALAKVGLPMRNAWHAFRYLHALWALGDREAVMRVTADYEREPKYRPSLTFIYPIIGEIDKALAGYEAAYAASEVHGLFIRSVPVVLRRHPRYRALLEKMHLDDRSLREAGLL